MTCEASRSSVLEERRDRVLVPMVLQTCCAGSSSQMLQTGNGSPTSRMAVQPVGLHFERGTQHTWDEYQRFLADHAVISSMSRIGSCADNASAKSFFGQLKRERVNRRRYASRADTRSDIVDYIGRLYNARKRSDAEQRHHQQTTLSELSTQSGRTPILESTETLSLYERFLLN